MVPVDQTDGEADLLLKQLALILAVVIVALLAIVAALTIINRDADDDAIDSDPAAVAGSGTTIVLSVGATGSPMEIGCRMPVEGESPLLVSFENLTDVVDDYQAQISVRHDDGTTSTAIAEARDLRPGERRNVLPEPWLDNEGIAGCEVVAVQTSDQVILVED